MDGELCGATYYAFDLLERNGEDLRRLPLRERKAALLVLQPLFPDWIRPIATARPGEAGGEYLATVLRGGGEGCVAKRLSAPYGYGWHKAKRRETFDVVVTTKAPGKLSLGVAQYRDDQLVPCGNVAVLNQTTFAELQAGDVLELTAQGRTRNRLHDMRHNTLDTWFATNTSDGNGCLSEPHDCRVMRISHLGIVHNMQAHNTHSPTLAAWFVRNDRPVNVRNTESGNMHNSQVGNAHNSQDCRTHKPQTESTL